MTNYNKSRKKDDIRAEQYIHNFNYHMQEVFARAIGATFDNTPVPIDRLINALFNACFETIAKEYIRMEESPEEDAEHIKLVREIIEHNIKHYEKRLPDVRKSYKVFKAMGGVL